jgi:ferredoxin-NADP reductase
VTNAPVEPQSPWHQAVIERIEPRTSRVKSIFLRTSLARHEAGQHIDVRLTAPDGYQAQRSYSIASAPGGDIIELAVERLEDGEVSPFLDDVALPGDAIEIRGPIGGHFVWRTEDGGPLLLIAGGSGVAPLMAMLRHRAAGARDTNALLVYSARTWEELIFREELLEAERRDPRFRFVVTTTREPRHRPQDFERRLDGALLGDIIRRWGELPRHVYVCGATAFVETVADALVSQGLPAGDIRTERYGGN